MKPPNQLRLSDAELAEELACSLSASNPAAPSNVARFIPKDNAYKVGPQSLSISPQYSSPTCTLPYLKASADSKRAVGLSLCERWAAAQFSWHPTR